MLLSWIIRRYFSPALLVAVGASFIGWWAAMDWCGPHMPINPVLYLGVGAFLYGVFLLSRCSLSVGVLAAAIGILPLWAVFHMRAVQPAHTGPEWSFVMSIFTWFLAVGLPTALVITYSQTKKTVVLAGLAAYVVLATVGMFLMSLGCYA